MLALNGLELVFCGDGHAEPPAFTSRSLFVLQG